MIFLSCDTIYFLFKIFFSFDIFPLCYNSFVYNIYLLYWIISYPKYFLFLIIFSSMFPSNDITLNENSLKEYSSKRIFPQIVFFSRNILTKIYFLQMLFPSQDISLKEYFPRRIFPSHSFIFPITGFTPNNFLSFCSSFIILYFYLKSNPFPAPVLQIILGYIILIVKN